ncbi:MAG: TonB-dependent receptor [Paludibacter sp.]
MNLKKQLILFLSFLMAFNVFAQTNDKNISISFTDIPLSEAIKKIESISKYTFFYDAQKIDLKQKVSLNVKNLSMQLAITKLLANSNIKFEITNLQIALYQKDVKLSQPNTFRKVTGVVTDEKDEPIIGASVFIKGLKTGTVTDANGNFSLDAPDQSTLIISYIGYSPINYTLGTEKNVKITLEEDARKLDEVVVVGYGTQKKGNVTGAIATLSSKDFSERDNTSIGSSMQGKSAGVQVTMPTGKPQSGFSIRVRGTASINAGSEPLYVVDGIPTTDTKDINPSDVESMSILKDAASAAIYGSSGANGVVIITTKRGSVQKPVVEFDASYGTTSPINRIDVLNATQYKALMTEMGRTLDWSQYPYNTNWQDQVFRTGKLQNYQVSVRGGTEKAKYYFSGGIVSTEGIVQTNKVQRYNFKMNLDVNPTDWLKVGGSFASSSWEDVDVPESRSSGQGGTILAMLNAAPITDIYNADGTFTGNPFMTSFENPLANIYGSNNLHRNWSLLGNIYLEAEPVKNLILKTVLGMDHRNGKYEEFLDPYKTDWGRNNVGIAYETADMYNYLISQNTISYKATFNEKYNFSILAGMIASTANTESLSVSAKNFSSTAVQTVNGASIMLSMNSDKAIINNLSYISSLNFDYDNKYLLTANFRADGASNFGKNNKWGYFPSFSAGWRISQEDFLKDNTALSDLKIRAGWGQVGNSGIGAYASYGTMGAAPYFMNGSLQSGKIPSTIDNTDLKWETTEQSNIGLDLAFFNYRLAFTVDAYYKLTKNLLYDYPLPLSTGYNTSVINIGSVLNKGLEFSVSSKNLVHDFKWNTDFNISFNKNMVLDVGNRDLMVGYIYGREEVSIIRAGYPLGTFWGYVSEGVDPQTGMIKYKGANSVGDVSDQNKEVIGDANPLFTAGLTNTFSYKGFDLSILFQSVYGNKIFNATRIDTEGMYNFYNQSTYVLKRWKIPGQITDIPKAIYGNMANSLVSSRFIEDGSYIRLKSVSLAYNVSASLLKKSRVIKELKCYVTAENLLTLTRYKGFDPEVSMYGNNGDNSEQNAAIGIDYGTYPQPRNIIFGLALKL